MSQPPTEARHRRQGKPHRLRDTTRALRRWTLEWLARPLTWLAAIWLKRIRRHRIQDLPKTRALFARVGIYPLMDHFYEPLIDRSRLDPDFRTSRTLHGIDWRSTQAFELLEAFSWQAELQQLKRHRPEAGDNEYYLHNGYFGPGDADLYYSLIRHLQPKQILELGCGHSTRLACMALEKNREEGAQGAMTCVEPYRRPEWLQALNVEHLATPAETLGIGFFSKLQPNDILFIDTSHIIRPQGDVLYLHTQILPNVPAGVYVHVHDIYSPLDYPNRWLVDEMRFWNEQYLLEAFLAFNDQFEIVAGLQQLQAADRDRLVACLPLLNEAVSLASPSSMWLRRR